jgi:hypothetical protein
LLKDFIFHFFEKIFSPAKATVPKVLIEL